MKHLFAGLLLLFTLAGSVHAFAAEAEAPPINDERADGSSEEETATADPLDDQSAADAENDEATDAEAEAGAPRDPNEPFVPSVQISEDLSVSFPVDI